MIFEKQWDMEWDLKESPLFFHGNYKQTSKNNFPYYLYPKSNEIYQLHISKDELLADATAFLAKWVCAIWASAQNCNFSWNQANNCVTGRDRKLYHCCSKPLTQWTHISSCYCGVLLLISSWENTAANGTLVLSLTCMIFLYEEWIGSALTVFYFLPCLFSKSSCQS